MRWQGNMRWLVVLAAAWCAGCSGETSPQGQKLLQASYQAYSTGDDAAVLRHVEQFLQQDGRSSRVDEAHYLRGLSRLRTKDLAGAKADLNEAISRTDRREMRCNASLALGDMHYDAGNMGPAETLYRQALANATQGQKPLDHIYYRLGCVLQRLSRWQEADLCFDRVVDLFPDEELGKRSANRTHSRAWTVQAGSYRQRDVAVNAMNKLAEKNLPAIARGCLRDKRPAYIVQVGRYPTFEQASEALKQVLPLRPDAFVAPTR